MSYYFQGTRKIKGNTIKVRIPKSDKMLYAGKVAYNSTGYKYNPKDGYFYDLWVEKSPMT